MEIINQWCGSTHSGELLQAAHGRLAWVKQQVLEAPPTPRTTEPTTTPIPYNTSPGSPGSSATRTAVPTSKNSKRPSGSPSTTQHSARHASRLTYKSDAYSSSGRSCPSSPKLPGGWPGNTSMSRRNTPTAHATTPNWQHFKKCPLHTGRDTLVDWSPTDTLQHHEGWPPNGHAHQATKHLFPDPLTMEATMRGALTQALH